MSQHRRDLSGLLHLPWVTCGDQLWGVGVGGPGYDGAGPGRRSGRWDMGPDGSVQSRNEEIQAKTSIRESLGYFLKFLLLFLLKSLILS